MSSPRLRKHLQQPTGSHAHPPNGAVFVLGKPSDVEFRERPVPQLIKPHEVLIAINCTGICGSDVHYWEHGSIGHFVIKDPMVLDYESAATVVKIGAEVKTLEVGDRVVLEPGYPCRD